MTMPDQMVDFQVGPQQPQQPQQQVQPPQQKSSISAFIVDDVKLFVSPMKALVNEFIKQVKKSG